MIQPEIPFVLKLLRLSGRSANSQICAVCRALFLTRFARNRADRQGRRSSFEICVAADAPRPRPDRMVRIVRVVLMRIEWRSFELLLLVIVLLAVSGI